MHKVALPWVILLGIGISGESAWAQIEFGECPLVHRVGNNLVVTYDDNLFPSDEPAELASICTASSPCHQTTIVVDTPLWREEQADLESFRYDLRQVFDSTGDAQSFTSPPRFLFTNLGNDPTTSQYVYEAVIAEEADAAGLDVQVVLPD